MPIWLRLAGCAVAVAPIKSVWFRDVNDGDGNTWDSKRASPIFSEMRTAFAMDILSIGTTRASGTAETVVVFGFFFVKSDFLTSVNGNDKLHDFE